MGEVEDDGSVANRPCERCGGRMVPAVYGMPSPEGMEAAHRGEFVLMGCIVPIDGEPMVVAVCNACQAEVLSAE